MAGAVDLASLEKHGFNETDIDRLAMEASVGPLTAIENLALKHELRRDTILCEFEASSGASRPPTVIGADSTNQWWGRELRDGLINASSPSLTEPSR
jgi:hypothetical protein